MLHALYKAALHCYPRTSAFLCASLLVSLAAGCGDEDGVQEDETTAFLLTLTKVEFGEVPVGENRIQMLRLRNTGSVPIEVELERRGNPISPIRAELSETNVPAGGSADIEVTFAPVMAGTYDAVFRAQIVGGSDTDPTAELRIDGSATEASGQAFPRTLTFPTLVPGRTSTLTFTLVNTGMQDVDVRVEPTQGVDRCGFMAQTPAAFCVDIPENAIVSLRPTQEREVSVEFRPRTPNATENGVITVRFCDSRNPNCTVEIALIGAATNDDLICTPEILDFGDLNPGQCARLSLSCANVTSLPLTAITTVLGSDTDPEFALVTGLPGNLSPGTTADASLEYCPEDPLEHGGTLLISSTRQGRSPRQDTVRIVGRGGGPDIVVPSRVDYGIVSTLAPARRTIKISNEGLGPLRVLDAETSTTTDSTWRVVTDLPFMVPGESVGELVVEVQPISVGRSQTELTIISNDRDEPRAAAELRVEGELLPPCRYISNAPEGEVLQLIAPVETATGASIFIENNGEVPCQVTAIELNQLSSTALRLFNTVTVSHRVEPGAQSRINLRFEPREVGVVTGTVFFGVSSLDEATRFRSFQVEATATFN